MVYAEHEGKTLYTSREKDPVKTLSIRAALILALIVFIIIVFWWHRADLRDTTDEDVTFLDVVYFTFITITTVGYGDIVPVTETARIIDAVLVTPLRIIIWLVFLGTAYEFIIPRYMEGYRLKNLKKRLSGHIILVGYGSTGKAVAEELVHYGNRKEDILVIDSERERTEEASSHGFVALRGDATREEMLVTAAISKAKDLIVATGKDDTNVLVVLTARHMNPKISIVARANLEENTKLLKRGGADVIVTPLVTGGKMIAASTIWKTAAVVLGDILSSKHGLRVSERWVAQGEVGISPKALPGIVVLAVKRGDRLLDPPELDKVKLRSSDLIVFVEAREKEKKAEKAEKEEKEGAVGNEEAADENAGDEEEAG